MEFVIFYSTTTANSYIQIKGPLGLRSLTKKEWEEYKDKILNFIQTAHPYSFDQDDYK